MGTVNIAPKRPTSASSLSVYGFILVIVSLYFIQAFSPLRVNTDAVILLSEAESADRGQGFLFHGRPTVYPPGYPAILATLMKLGLAHSRIFIITNAVCVVIGTMAVFLILRWDLGACERSSLVICGLGMLSFAIIKHATIALTDIPFYCLSMLCLVSAIWIKRQIIIGRYAACVISCWVLLIGAILIRRTGVVLIPVFLYAASSAAILTAGRRRVINLFGLLVMGLISGWVILAFYTIRDLGPHAGLLSVPHLIFTAAKFRIADVSEIALNLPLSKVPMPLRLCTPAIGIVVIGMVATAIIVALLRRGLSCTMVFLVSYSAVLFAWPFRDSRFIIPVVPLLMGYVWFLLRQYTVAARIATFYAVAFAAVGVGAFAYSTRISFSDGKQFISLYGDKSSKADYCAAWHLCPAGDKADTDAVNLIQRFN